MKVITQVHQPLTCESVLYIRYCSHTYGLILCARARMHGHRRVCAVVSNLGSNCCQPIRRLQGATSRSKNIRTWG